MLVRAGFSIEFDGPNDLENIAQTDPEIPVSERYDAHIIARNNCREGFGR